MHEYKGILIKLSIRDCWKDKIWSLIPNYISYSSLTFLVFAMDNKESFLILKNWINFIKNIKDRNIIIAGNIIDLNDNYQVLKEDEKLCQENKSKYLKISAKKGTNITNLLYSLEISLPILTINT